MKSIILCDSNVLINDTCQCKVIACIVYMQIYNWIFISVPPIQRFTDTINTDLYAFISPNSRSDVE